MKQLLYTLFLLAMSCSSANSTEKASDKQPVGSTQPTPSFTINPPNISLPDIPDAQESSTPDVQEQPEIDLPDIKLDCYSGLSFCKEKELYSCINNFWKLNSCQYLCKDGKCVGECNPGDIKKEDNYKECCSEGTWHERPWICSEYDEFTDCTCYQYPVYPYNDEIGYSQGDSCKRSYFCCMEWYIESDNNFGCYCNIEGNIEMTCQQFVDINNSIWKDSGFPNTNGHVVNECPPN